MTTEHLQTDKSKLSSTNVESPNQMRGWFKLIETIRKTEPPSNELVKSPSNSNTNGYLFKSPDTIHIDSPQSKSPDLISSSPVINLPSTPIQTLDDTPSEPSPKATEPKRRSTRHKKITIRKSSRSKESLSINPLPDDEIISPDLHQRKRQSIDSSISIPLATDLQSLPGHNQDELRDQRFLDYTDMNTLSLHLNRCLSIDKKSFSSLNKQHFFKTRHNILNKIFKLYYLKTLQKYSKINENLFSNEKSPTKINQSSVTTNTFKTDWSVNRKNSSSYRLEPKNVFHILQLNPKKHLSLTTDNQASKNLSIEDQYEIYYEQMKSLLIRTYHPHFHHAFQYGFYFGSKSKIPIKHHDVPVSNKSEPTVDIDESMTITLKSPPSIFQQETRRRGRKPKHKKLQDKPRPIISTERRVSEEIPAVEVVTPIQISSPPPPVVEKESRKRKISITIENKNKKSIPSPEIGNQHQDVTYSDSDEDVPTKQIFIKNGLRSKHQKSTTEIDLKPISQKQEPTPSKSKKKKSVEPKQKPEISYKNFSRNIQTDLPAQQTSNKILQPLKIEDLTCHEKQIVSETSIFLKRNLQRIKEKRQLKDKNNHQQKQDTGEQPLPMVFPQNYYHSNQSNPLNLSHKDILNLFSNHIRRSYSYKTGRCSIELLDKTCYYAQLGQLTLILNEIFDLLLNYKCQSSEIYPSNALKKCPLKRLFPMYYEIIVKPIDLTIIQNKLDNGDYFSYHLFEQDLLLLFKNAITYCGEDSDIGRAVKELEKYFLNILKIEYQLAIDLFNNIEENNKNERNLQIFTDFIARLHERERTDGQIRKILYEIIFDIDQNNSSNINPQRIIKNSYIIHCRCGSTFDETPLVQCYACQLWQHVSCVTINNSYQAYYCFECYPQCEENSLLCLKTNVNISNDNQASYSTITRSDGLIIRINECYFIKKQEESKVSKDYDIFSIERLWFDEKHIGYASGFYYLRPYETFHEANRKFFSNEIFRFPSTNDSIEINSIIRPCYVLDPTTYCKGKPLAEYTSRIIPADLFICEYRVDKLARIFTRIPKSKHIGINTKSYCFDSYIEKLSIKRDYQSHQKEYHQNSARRSITHPMKLTSKQLEEKSSHIDGIIERIYCHFHHSNLIPSETKFSPNQFFQQPIIDKNNNRGSKRLREKHTSSTILTNKKRRTRSISSNDNPIECISDNNQHIISSLLDELIELISSH